MEVIVAYILDERRRSHKAKHSEKEVILEDLKVDTNDANPDIATDMEIEIAKEDQLPNVQNVINTDEDFEPVMSKSKRKREKRKQKLRKKKQVTCCLTVPSWKNNLSTNPLLRSHVPILHLSLPLTPRTRPHLPRPRISLLRLRRRTLKTHVRLLQVMNHLPKQLQT
jgi:hypothetical protein